MFRKIILLCSDCPTAPVFYNAFPEITTVVMEPPQSKKALIRGRIRRLGLPRVLGQLAFQALVPPLLRRFSAKRVKQIQQAFGLDDSPIPAERIRRVASVNSADCRDLLASLAPDLVLVHGTRIISEATLASVECPWANIHAGITPAYRGTHGAYWALHRGDHENCGVTLHLVDRGIDTGRILAQARVFPRPADNFTTYPWLQLAEGLKLLRQALESWPETRPSQGTSALYHHPTLGQYLSGALRGVY